MVLVQSSFHTTWASLFEMVLEPNSLVDWNGNELEHKLELEDMKRTYTIEVKFQKKMAYNAIYQKIIEQYHKTDKIMNSSMSWLEALPFNQKSGCLRDFPLNCNSSMVYCS
jgi:hypothetical protein